MRRALCLSTEAGLDRMSPICYTQDIGDFKPLGDGLYELRWRNGTRVYYSYVAGDDGRLVLMLWGGDKNGQSRDISKARKLQGRASA